MDFGGSPEAEIDMPIVSYGPNIHESSSKLKMLTMAGGGVGGAVGGNAVHPLDHEMRPPEPGVKKAVKYRECLKNHAASMGGHAVDGCGEFMPSGEEGTLEALTCAACNCHRNFHRKEVEGEPPCYCFSLRKDKKRLSPMVLPAHVPLPLPSSPMVRQSAQLIMALNSTHSESDDQEIGMPPGTLPHPTLIHPSASLPLRNKRFRTKFTSEQKDKMLEFAEKLGWRIQKHDEASVQQFCADVDVKRHVLKVWMHNNKHTLGKKLFRFTEPFHPGPESS